MDIIALAETLVPFILQGGAKELGKVAVDKILAILSPKLESKDAKVLENCAQAPNDVTLLEQKNLSVALLNLFDKEPAIAEIVAKILEQTGQKNIIQSSNVSGNGNQVVQIVGSNNR